MEPSEDRGGATRATRCTIWLSLAAVAATAAAASYIHALAVVRAADGDTPVAFFIAALADPAIFAASVNIMDASRRGLPRPRWSMVSIGVALAVTLGANVAAGNPHAVPSWLVNVWPPVAFLMALESLISYVRRGQRKLPAASPAPPGPPETGPALSPREWLDEYVRSLSGERAEREVAAVLGISRNRVRSALVTPGDPPPAPEPPAGAGSQPVPAGSSLALSNGSHDG